MVLLPSLVMLFSALLVFMLITVFSHHIQLCAFTPLSATVQQRCEMARYHWLSYFWNATLLKAT